MQKTSAKDLVDWIDTVQGLGERGKCDSLSFFKPFHLVTIGLALKKAGAADFTITKRFESYAARMHLWESIGIEGPYDVYERDEDGRFLPVEAFERETGTTTDITKRLSALASETSAKQSRALSICLEELVNNFYDHSETRNELPCLVAAQSWQKGGLVQVAIADAGKGVRASLSQNNELYTRLRQENACKIASEYGVTSKESDHSGYGLTLAKDLMKQVGGTYALLSGNELYICQDGKEKVLTPNVGWTGTLLLLEWSIDSPMNSKLVYDSWPLPKGMNKDDYL